MQCNGNFKQWFNIFLIISEAWQGYESKAYGVSNHNLNLQSKKLSRTRDIPIFQHKVERTPHFTRVTEVRHIYVSETWVALSVHKTTHHTQGSLVHLCLRSFEQLDLILILRYVHTERTRNRAKGFCSNWRIFYTAPRVGLKVFNSAKGNLPGPILKCSMKMLAFFWP